MYSVSLVVLIVVGLVGSCRGGRIDGKIVGGSEISIEKAPYQVALLYYGSLLCGGSILSCKFILTAAHCMDPRFEIESFRIRAGSSIYKENGTLYEIKQIDIHPNYDRMLYDYDAAILTLMTYIKFDSFKQPIKLPFQNEALPEGSHVATSGWGLTGDSEVPSLFLKMVNLTITNQVECHKKHAADGGITTRMVCAATIGEDSCEGDSGGPLVDLKTKKLVGIVSFGYKNYCALDGVPGVYARIASFRSWIREIINF